MPREVYLIPYLVPCLIIIFYSRHTIRGSVTVLIITVGVITGMTEDHDLPEGNCARRRNNGNVPNARNIESSQIMSLR